MNERTGTEVERAGGWMWNGKESLVIGVGLGNRILEKRRSLVSEDRS